jgi:hypothetical protein
MTEVSCVSGGGVVEVNGKISETAAVACQKPALYEKYLMRRRSLPQRRIKDAKRCRVFKGFLCAFAPWRENISLHLRSAEQIVKTQGTGMLHAIGMYTF